MRKLMLGVVLGALVALPATVMTRETLKSTSPAGVARSESAGNVLRSSLGRSFESRVIRSREAVSGAGHRIEETEHPAERTDSGFGLLPNYPNPFNPTTTITYSPENDARVELAVYDVSGRLVRTLADHRCDAGSLHQVVWDGTGDGGERLPSGVYLLRLLNGTSAETRKLVLLK